MNYFNWSTFVGVPSSLLQVAMQVTDQETEDPTCRVSCPVKLWSSLLWLLPYTQVKPLQLAL